MVTLSASLRKLLESSRKWLLWEIMRLNSWNYFLISSVQKLTPEVTKSSDTWLELDWIRKPEYQKIHGWLVTNRSHQQLNSEWKKTKQIEARTTYLNAGKADLTDCRQSVRKNAATNRVAWIGMRRHCHLLLTSDACSVQSKWCHLSVTNGFKMMHFISYDWRLQRQSWPNLCSPLLISALG